MWSLRGTEQAWGQNQEVMLLAVNVIGRAELPRSLIGWQGAGVIT